MADHTVQELFGDPIAGEWLGTPRTILLDGFQTLDSAITITGETITVRQPTTVSLSWFVPVGTTQLVVNTNYPASMDSNGSRPKGTIKQNTALGISAQEVEATAGAELVETITFNFSATPAAGNVHVVLEVPLGADFDGSTVTFAPQVKSGEGVNAQPGKEPGATSRAGRSGGIVIGG